MKIPDNITKVEDFIFECKQINEKYAPEEIQLLRK